MHHDLRLSTAVEDDRNRIVDTLFRWLAIPSISAAQEHQSDVIRSAEFLAQLCDDSGLENVEVIDTPGHPAVYADWLHAIPGAPTVLIYGHHDVQPVEPLEEWSSPPFTPVLVNEECLARGAIDDKGQVLYQVMAIRSLLESCAVLPVNVKLLIEGEEEVGSPNFEQLLIERSRQFQCDAIVVSDTGMISPDVPSVDVSMRGLVACTLTIKTGERDLHSGLFGGAVPNPIHHLTRLLAALHSADGKVSISGFYDRVCELSGLETRSLSEQPFDADEFLATAAVKFLEGENGRSTLERIGARPTAEVVGVSGGYEGPGMKTIVPATASAKITFRLVPDQQPKEIMSLVESWIETFLPDGVEWQVDWHGGVAPARTDVSHWAFEALCRSIAKVWGKRPLLTRVGGSGPEEALGRVLSAPVLFLGVGLPGDRIHAPNERMVMDQFWRGLLAAGELLYDLADTAAMAATEGHN